jgi:two-component system CheB/CheR fusion protein
MGKAVVEKDTVVKRKSKPYPIVAIGASAGGLEAIRELLENLPTDSGMAYVYIQHLDPTHKSMLSEILQRATKMKVLEAKHLMHIQPNHVFIIPPNKDMAIIDGVLTLNPRKAKPSIHLPVDNFFSSLAEKQKEGAIGIVLSGNASDGTFGLKAIKLAGGLTFAQDDSAKFQSMPQSAIGSGVVDMVLSPKEIAKELERISRHPATSAIIEEKPDHISENDIPNNDEDLANIVQLLKKATSVDFSHYKMNTIKRRVLRRMLIYKQDTLADYYHYLKQHTGEINVLYQDILINVTSFFRDPDAMEYVKKTLIPRILKTKKPNEPIRVWVPACASGEEAYSLAMVFMEVLGDKAVTTPLQIFASDLSELSIAKARMGLYAQSDLADVSPERIKRFFEKIDGAYRVVKSIRDLCVFANHNVFRDPPFSRLDLVSCCNFLIYLDNVLQKRLLSIFHYAVLPNGFLILGKSETISASQHLFSQIEKKYRIYIRKNESSDKAIFDMHYRVHNAPVFAGKGEKVAKKNAVTESDFEKTVEEILLKEFIPASVVINSNLEILQFNGSTGLFLEPSHGKASLNLLKMARSGLSYELRNAVHKAGKSGERIKKTGLEIKIREKVHQVSIEVVPLPADEEQLFLIVFEEFKASPTTETKSNLTRDKLVKQLQTELLAAKEDMHSIIEEQEASVEELQSANEEIISSNEELQTVNEELETTKEEVESANEELLTINNELQVRNEQLSESYEYSQAIFDTIEEAVLVLDKNFKVKTANKSFYKIFQVKEQDTEGMLLYELGNRQWNILKLRELLEDVIANNKSFKGLEIEHNFPQIGKKIMLLNARRITQQIQRQHLIILAISDISEQRHGERIIAEQEARFRNMANNVPAMLWTTGIDRDFNFVNKTWLKFTGRRMEQEMGMGWTQNVHKDDLAQHIAVFTAHFNKKEAFSEEFRLRRHDGEYRWVREDAEPNFSQEGEFLGYIGSCAEIHDEKLAHIEMEQIVEQRTRELKEAITELSNKNLELGQFAYVASHDLQEPLRKIITFSDRLLEKSRERPRAEQDYLDKIIFCTEKMRKLINDLLNFSKASRSGKEFKEVDLNKVVKEVVKDLDLLIDEKKAKLSIEKLPVIQGLPHQLHQLFTNLITNSLKFSTDKGVPQIKISSKEMKDNELSRFPNFDSKEAFYEIIIQDNGIGFQQDFAEQIFTIFQRLDNEGKYLGSGIGLALCRKIVINHRGLIFAKSEPDKGAAFHVILPMEQ